MDRCGVNLTAGHGDDDVTKGPVRRSRLKCERREFVLIAAETAASFVLFAMDHLIDSAVNASSSLVSSIVSGVMETTNQLMSRSLIVREDVCSEAGSTDSADNQFLILTEDHFSELADEELDPTGVCIFFSFPSDT